MEWGEVLDILNLAFTDKGVALRDIRNASSLSPPAETVYREEGENNTVAPSNVGVTNIADWKKRKNK